MLVQALAEYADHYLADELNDAAWEMKPVPWSLEISRQGRFLNATPRMTTETRGKKQVQVPMQMSVPRSPVNRNSGEHPLLGTDDIAYVLGVGPWTPDKPADKEKAEKHHEAFVALIGKAAKETVAPHKGAWIETVWTSVVLPRSLSRPTRARGLKRFGPLWFCHVHCRAPQGRVD